MTVLLPAPDAGSPTAAGPRPPAGPNPSPGTPPGPVRLTGLQFLLPLLGLVVLLGVPLGLFVSPVIEAGGASLSVPVVLFGVIVVYCAVRLTQLMWAAEPRWMVLGLWMFSYSWIGVAGLTQTLAGSNPLGLTLPPEIVVEQSALLLFGLICFDAASRLTPARTAVGMPEAVTTRLRGRILEPRRVMALSLASLLVSPVLVTLLGGPSALFSSRQAVDDTLSASGLYSSSTNAVGGTVFVVAGTMPFVAFLCLAKLLADDREFRARLLPWGFVVALAGVNILVNNPISNARYWAFAIVLAVVFASRISLRPLVLAGVVLAFSVSALTLFPYLDQFRYSDSDLQQSNVQVNSFDNAVDYVLAKTDYASVTDVGVAIRVVDHQGHTLGRQLLGAAAFWVPRTLWPDKPDNTAFLIADDIGFTNRNLDSPLWAEGYIDFGWFGTALLLGGAGLLARRGDDAFVALQAVRTRAVPLAAVAIPVIAGYEYILIRGSLLQAMARIVAMLVLLYAISHLPEGHVGPGRHRADGRGGADRPTPRTTVPTARTPGGPA